MKPILIISGQYVRPRVISLKGEVRYIPREKSHQYQES